MDTSYLSTTRDVYQEAPLHPQEGLCCATRPVWQLPELAIPKGMLAMNYGCGSTVNPRDLAGSPTVLYVGVGGGMEVLQFAYFTRRTGAVIGLDVVDEMLAACRTNLCEAELQNPWFKSSFVDLRKGDALDLPVADGAVDVAAQNCLFNIFRNRDLERALCLTGAIPLDDYVKRLTDTGFGTIEVRARRPYRVLSPRHYPTDRLIVIESVEICAIKDPMPADGPCVFTAR